MASERPSGSGHVTEQGEHEAVGEDPHGSADGGQRSAADEPTPRCSTDAGRVGAPNSRNRPAPKCDRGARDKC
eukprot:13963828-Alexandrium_andersonii.AAC.1